MRMKKIVLSLVLMLFLGGNAVFAHHGGHGPHGGGMHGPLPVVHHRPAMPPVMHGGPHHVRPVPPPRHIVHPRVYVGARINPYYYADCINPMGYYDPYYCGTYYAPGVVRFSLPRAGITFAF